MAELITKEMQEIKVMIALTCAKRETLKNDMQTWSDKFPTKKFERLNELIITDSVLSKLDSNYKRLWDFNNAKERSE